MIEYLEFLQVDNILDEWIHYCFDVSHNIVRCVVDSNSEYVAADDVEGLI